MSTDPGETTRLRLRFTLGDAAMLVVASAAGSALFAKIYRLLNSNGGGGSTLPWLQVDVPAVLVLGIALTAISLGSYKGHSPGQVMLQATLACLGYLSLISIIEAGLFRLQVYWLQAWFALLVAGPLVARRFVKTTLPRGDRRAWWMKSLEAVVFSAVNMALVGLGAALQWYMVLAFR